MVEISSFSDSKRTFQVALPVPLRTLFDYLASELDREPEIGDRVEVPFGNRQLIGIVLGTAAIEEIAHPEKLKKIIAIAPSGTGINAELIKLVRWVSDYYCHPIGECIAATIPPQLKQNLKIQQDHAWQHTTEGMGLSADALKRSPKQQEIHQHLLEHYTLHEANVKREGFSSNALKALQTKGLIEKKALDWRHLNSEFSGSTQILKEAQLELNDEQKAAVETVRLHEFACHLLHGITGSGKTEVYLQLTSKALQTGTQALILVPEIGLSPQTVERFKKRFAVEIAELHSGVSDAQRAKNWLAARCGRAKIVIGTRLSALCALENPGLIVIDEEHDASYKQQDGVRYSARDLSIVRAKLNQIPIVLGSATPSLETLRNAIEGHYNHLVLRQRATGVISPKLRCLDIRGQQLRAGLSSEAIEEIKAALSENNQILVFLNRRGFAPMQLCHSCGWVAECPSCSANLTLHQFPPRLHCHHCDWRAPVQQSCPRCHSTDLDSRGIGTEQLEGELKTLFPNNEIIRVDRDSTRSKSAFKSTFERIHSGEPAILVGTQMLAKGHHFPNLNLVVIADADQGFLNPDFRATEKMGQLLMQVAGRSGREQVQGRVLIQTHQPEHPLMQKLLAMGYTSFAKDILHERALNRLSPYWYAATFRAESKRLENVIQLLELIKASYHNHFPPSPSFYLIGPMPCAIERVQDRFRYQLKLQSQHRAELKTVTQHLVSAIEQQALSKRVRWSIDIDPIES